MAEPERNIFMEMMAEALLPHPSGECRCVFPGTNVTCRLDNLHDGDHEAPPIRLVSGAMSGPIHWPQNRPRGGDNG